MHIKSISPIRISLVAVAVATSLVACEDQPSPTLKARPPVTAAPPITQAPEPVAPTPPPAPEPAKTETLTVKPEETKPVVGNPVDDKPIGALAGARKLLEDGELDKGLELAQLAVRQTPKRSAAWNTLGRVQLRMGHRKDAIASFEKAVELNPSNSYAHNNLGLALIYDKRFEDAVEALEEAVELEPVEGYMWNNLGMAYEQLDRLTEAREAYGKAVEMESERARESLARLKGVDSVIRTAKVEPDTKGQETTTQ